MQSIILSLLFASSLGRVVVDEDLDLTGCSVSLNAYIFNLENLMHFNL